MKYFTSKNLMALAKQHIKINRIAAVLKDHNVRQKELAARLQIDPAVLSRYCTNTVQPSLLLLHQIATELQVDIRQLLHPTYNKGISSTDHP